MSRSSNDAQLHEAQLDALAVIEAVMRDDHDALEAITASADMYDVAAFLAGGVLDQPIPRPAAGKPPTAPNVAGSPWLTPEPDPDETPPQDAA